MGPGRRDDLVEVGGHAARVATREPDRWASRMLAWRDAWWLKKKRYASTSDGGQPTRLGRGHHFLGKRRWDGAIPTSVDRNTEEETPWQSCAQDRGLGGPRRAIRGEHHTEDMWKGGRVGLEGATWLGMIAMINMHHESGNYMRDACDRYQNRRGREPCKSGRTTNTSWDGGARRNPQNKSTPRHGHCRRRGR